MSDYTKFRRGVDFTGWLRMPQSEKFMEQFAVSVEALRMNLHGACASSSDERVRENYGRYEEMRTLLEFLRKSRKESAADDDE